VSETPNKTCYEQIKDFLYGIWKWLTSWYCCVAFTDPTRAKDLEAIGKLAERGYIWFVNKTDECSTLESNLPATAFLSSDYGCQITVKGRVFNSLYAATFGLVFRDDELIDEFSRFKADETKEMETRSTEIKEQASKDSAYAQKVFGMTFEEFKLNQKALFKEVLKLKFETVLGLKERLLATGDCWLVEVGDYNDPATELMELREALGGKKPAPEAQLAYDTALAAAGGTVQAFLSKEKAEG
jgi:hypothetical protein